MYDEPPDPEPNPCPMCEEELGYGKDCPHCAMAMESAKARAELATLRRTLGSRVRKLADQQVHADDNPANGVSPRFLMAAALLMELGGLKLPDELLDEARRSVTDEYGESVNEKADPERIERWTAMQFRAVAEGKSRFLPPDVLDRRGGSQLDMLWILHLLDGRHVVATEAEKRKRNDWSGGSGGPWGQSLREFIDDALRSRERGVGHWVEFALKYAKPPAGELKQGDKVSYVVGVEAYTAYVGYYVPSPYGGTGFGGAPFVVQLADGRRFFTNNNWAVGTVPEHMRKELRPNASFGLAEEADRMRRQLQNAQHATA